MKKNTKKLVYAAVLCAMALVLTYIVRFPLFPSAPFLEYDMGEVPLFIGAAVLGPWTGLLMTAAVCILQGIFLSAQSGIIGVLMHFFATGSFVLTAGFLLSGNKTKSMKLVIPSFVCGALSMVLNMIPLNLLMTPIFFMDNNEIAVQLKVLGENIPKLVGGAFGMGSVKVALLCGFVCALAVCFVGIISYVFLRKKMKSETMLRRISVIACTVVAAIWYGAVVLLLMNMIFADVHFAGGMEAVYGLMFSTLIPFNAIKAVLNTAIATVILVFLQKHIQVD